MTDTSHTQGQPPVGATSPAADGSNRGAASPDPCTPCTVRPYQRRGAELLAGDSGCCGLWWAAGAGKTWTTLLAVGMRNRYPVLVLTKAIGRHVWARDIGRALPGVTVSTMHGGSKKTKTGIHRDGSFSDLEAALAHGQIIVINYEVVKTRYHELRHVPWAGMVLDEAHSVKQGFMPPRTYESGKTKWRTFETVLYLARDVRRQGGYVWELTATPIRDRLRDLWGQLVIADPATLWRWDWLIKYCGAHQGQYGYVTEGTDKAHLPELKERLVYLFDRVSRDMIADQLPTIQRDIRTVDGKASWRYLGGGIETAINQSAEIKVDSVIELMTEYLAQGLKVVAVTNRKRLAGKLMAELQRAVKKDVPPKFRRNLWMQMVTGDTPVRPRQRLLDDFQGHKGAGAVVATADCMMQSIDLHQADALIFAALPYTPFMLVQMEGRVARLGGKPATIYYLIAENSIDVEIRERLLDKLGTVEAANADTQGGTNAAGAFVDGTDGDKVIGELVSWLGGLK